MPITIIESEYAYACRMAADKNVSGHIRRRFRLRKQVMEHRAWPNPRIQSKENTECR